jgi:hypothetical protein
MYDITIKVEFGHEVAVSEDEGQHYKMIRAIEPWLEFVARN